MDELNGKRVTRISIQQTHETNALIGFFKMPMVTEVHYKDGSSDSTTTWVEKEFTEIRVPNNGKKEIAYVLVDPNRNIIKQVNFSRSFEELSAQFTTAKNMIDRYDALLELKKTELSKKKDVLIKQFDAEKFFLVKSEIIAQLGDDTDASTLNLMKKAMNDADVNVRKAVVNTVKVVNPSLKPEMEKMLADSSYAIIISALDLLCYNFPENTDGYLEQTKNTDGNMFHNVRIKWLEVAFEKTKDMKYLYALRDYADISRYDNPSVSAAITAFKRINYLDSTLAGYLFNAACYWSGPVNAPAKTALTFFFDQNAYKRLLKDQYKTLDGTMKETLKEFK